MSGCEVWKLPQRDRDRWDVWTLCELIGGCGQDECTIFEEAEASWNQEEAELGGIRGELPF